MATGDMSLDNSVLIGKTGPFTFSKDNPKLTLQLVKYVYDPSLD